MVILKVRKNGLGYEKMVVGEGEEEEAWFGLAWFVYS